MKSASRHPQEGRRLEALRRTELLDSAPSREFDDATRLASFICQTPIALVSLVDEHRQWFKSRVGLDATETPRDVAFCAHAILGTETFVVRDAYADARFADNPLVTGGPRVVFYAGVPLITEGGDALGTLCAIDHVPRELSREQLDALAALARQVVAQISLGERTRELTRRAEEITLVNELGELLQSCRTTDETHRVVTAYAERLFPGTCGALAVTRASRDQVLTAASWGDGVDAELAFCPEDCWALRRGRAHVVSAARGAVVCDHVPAAGRAAYVCVPMAAEGETLGILHVSEVSGPMGEARVQVAIAAAERIGLALANARLRENLRNQSIRDPLTGLFNRRYLDESLEREVRRSLRHGRPLSVLVIDIDHFKRFNDQFGHDAGDAVLRTLGTELKKRLRVEDTLCRFGGEEFVAILAEGELGGSLGRAEELCRAARALVVHHEGVPLGTVTLSIGVAALGMHGDSGTALLKAADEALYRAKAEGRDRVVLAQRRSPVSSIERPSNTA